MSFYVIMELFSREYGWTPNQIRELSNDDISHYFAIINIRRQKQKAEELRLRAKNKHGRK